VRRMILSRRAGSQVTGVGSWLVQSALVTVWIQMTVYPLRVATE
jgi:hypothetical protein